MVRKLETPGSDMRIESCAVLTELGREKVIAGKIIGLDSGFAGLKTFAQV